MCASGNVLQTHVLVATVFTSESCVQKNWKKYLFVIFVSFLLLSLIFVKYIFLLILKKKPGLNHLKNAFCFILETKHNRNKS